MNEAINLKDPAAVLEYGFDWQRWLVAGDTVSEATWSIPAGLTQVSSSIIDGNKTVVWLSGGVAGTTYSCSCHVKMAPSGREDDRTLQIVCKER